jgi:hypothetical protein
MVLAAVAAVVSASCGYFRAPLHNPIKTAWMAAAYVSLLVFGSVLIFLVFEIGGWAIGLRHTGRTGMSSTGRGMDFLSTWSMSGLTNATYSSDLSDGNAMCRTESFATRSAGRS